MDAVNSLLPNVGAKVRKKGNCGHRGSRAIGRV